MTIKCICSFYIVLAMATVACAQTPVDVSNQQFTPTVFASPAADGSVDVAWRTTDGRLMLSTYSGPNWSNGRTVQINTGLNLLGGLVRDEIGNRYVAAFRRERASAQEWQTGYRPNVAHLLRIDSSGNQSILADLNTKTFSKKWPIINPLAMASNSFVNSQMVYSNGTMVLATGHNNGKPADIHETGFLVGVGTDGSVRYDNGGEQHPGQVALAVDGANFIKAQIFDQGIGMSSLKQTPNGYKWSDFVLIYEIPRQNQAEEALTIAGVVPVPDGYLLIFSSGKGWLWNFNESELGTDGSCAIKVMKVSKNFDQLPKFDWWSGVKHAQGGFPIRNIAVPAPGKSYIRPIVQKLSDGRSIVLAERWGKDGFQALAEGVYGALIDSAGNPQQGTFIQGVRIQKCTTAFLLPKTQRVGWVNGDAKQNRLVMHTIDSSLGFNSYHLGQGLLGGSTKPAMDNSTHPTKKELTLQDIVGTYQVKQVTNNWQKGKISLGANNSLTWSNEAGVSWKLSPDLRSQLLRTGDDSPYQQTGPRDFNVLVENGRVTGFTFGQETYHRANQ